MPIQFEDCALVKFLSGDEEYRARVQLLRREMEKWLQYTVATFPHYTSHTRDHSEQIILQLSRLLFRQKGKRYEPTLALSRAEAYVLICAAYLHDAGMVASPGELESILASERWKQFTADGGPGSTWWRKIERLRAERDPKAPDLGAFRADLELRLLLADFIRREHHHRARLALALHPTVRPLVDFNDRRYFEAIAAVAVGHGLERSELNDPGRYKQVADLGGEQVNVQFMARLLRVGDLLDMRAARADPGACAAAGPLPADSRVHWQQYSTIVHERVDPERIEYTCECRNQDTHAVLRDWFGWLRDEVREAGLAMLHAERHAGWRPPLCALEDEEPAGGQATLVIRAAPEATYTFRRWKLELDQDQILDRLIYDIYAKPETFIRELIQNALDATRCRMYEDFPGRYPYQSPPAVPTGFPPEFLEDYPLELSLKEEEVVFPGTDERRRCQVFTIEDLGTGMDSGIVHRYLLQVGRSFYQSEEFRRRYRFAPTSRFGVGFLSVFAVSSLVTVETARLPLPPEEPYGLRLTLRGPRSYLLTDRCSPFEARPATRRHGARIRVVLDEPIKAGILTALAKIWCLRVEVPIQLTDLDGKTTSIRSKPIRDRSIVFPSRHDPHARFELRSFEISRPGVEGEVFRLAYLDERGETWLPEWNHEDEENPLAAEPVPSLPEGYTTLHGILHGSESSQAPPITSWRVAVDDRRPFARTTLARTGPRHAQPRAGLQAQAEALDPEIIARRRIEEAISEHLRTASRAQANDGWRYAGSVLTDSMIDFNFACAWPNTIQVYEKGLRRLASGKEVLELNPGPTVLFHPSNRAEAVDLADLNGPALVYHELPGFFAPWISRHVKQGGFESARILQRRSLIVNLAAPKARPMLILHHRRAAIAPFGDSTVFSVLLLGSLRILNENHPLTRWLRAVLAAEREGSPVVTRELADTALKVLIDLREGIRRFLADWREIPGMPQALMPPEGWGSRRLNEESIAYW